MLNCILIYRAVDLVSLYLFRNTMRYKMQWDVFYAYTSRMGRDACATNSKQNNDNNNLELFK